MVNQCRCLHITRKGARSVEGQKKLNNPLAVNVQGHWMPARHALSLQPVVCGSQSVRRMSCRGVTHVGDLTSQMFRHATANWKGNMSWTERPEIVGVDLAETDGK